MLWSITLTAALACCPISIAQPISGPSSKVVPVASSSVQQSATTSSPILEVGELLREGKIVPGSILVDVREPVEFRMCRIPGSLNLPLHLIRTKKFLQSHRVVLVNQGHDSARLGAEAVALSRAGFKSVFVLRSGLRSWQAVGGGLEGENPKGFGAAAISPAQLQESHEPATWLVVSVGEVTATREGVQHLHLDVNGSEDLFHSFTLGNPRIRTIVAVTEEGRGYEEIERKVAQRRGSAEVFYLQGGWRAYDEFLRQQTLMANRGEGKLTEQASLRSSRNFQPQGAPGTCCGGKR